MKRKDYILIAGILLTHLLLLIFLKFTAWPEMSLWPYLMSHGWLPYRDIAVAHTPLLLFNLAIFYKIFGVGILQLKIFTWILILLSDVLVFFVVKKIWNIKTAFAALIFYGLWLMIYDGNGLWFDLYMGLTALVSFYFAHNKKWFLTGVFWALAFISKQTAVWFLLPIGLAMVNGKWSMVKNILRRPLKGDLFKATVKFIKGVLAVFVPFVLVLLIAGLLPDFWNWAVKFGVFILPKAQGQIQLPSLKNLAFALYPFLVFVPLLLKLRSKILNLVLWAFAGALGAYPRFEYFHFLPAVPFLAIAVGLLLAEIKNFKKYAKILIGAYFLGLALLFGGYFIKNIREGTRFYESNVKNLVLYVKYNTSPGDRIFVMNWWDNIYALTDTLPSTDPWVPQLPWYMELPGVQEEMVEGLTANPPKLIIYYPYTMSGLSAYTPQKVYNFVMENYKIVQKVDGVEILMQKQGSDYYAQNDLYEDSNIK